MKRIYLLRHAKSSRDDPLLVDFERPLAPRGERACRTMQRAMSKAGIAPDIILCSSSRRTRDTLAGVFPALPEAATVKIEKRLYLASADSLLRQLRRLNDKVETVLLIGHNPGLQELALRLVGNGRKALVARLKAKFPTAALAEIACDAPHWADLGAGNTRLVGLTSPKDDDA